MKYRILVSGSRKFQNKKLFHDTLSPFYKEPGVGNPDAGDEQELFDLGMPELEAAKPGPESNVIIHGGANGLDSIAQEWCESHMMESEVHYADWARYPIAAGPIRNREMLNTGVDILIAFPLTDVPSKGTWDMIRQCERAGVKTIIVSSASYE